MTKYRFLLVDDQYYKYDSIKSIFDEEIVDLIWIESPYEINDYLSDVDLILLDMSFDSSHDPIEGVVALDFVSDNDINCPIVVITQHYNFYGKNNDENNKICYKNDLYLKTHDYTFDAEITITTLPELHEYLSQNYKDYLGCVLYNQASTNWIKYLKILLEEIHYDKCINIG